MGPMDNMGRSMGRKLRLGFVIIQMINNAIFPYGMDRNMEGWEHI